MRWHILDRMSRFFCKDNHRIHVDNLRIQRDSEVIQYPFTFLRLLQFQPISLETDLFNNVNNVNNIANSVNLL